MREILFKAKRVDNGEWVEGNIVISEDAEEGYEAIIIPKSNSNMFTKGGSKGDLGFENWYKVDVNTICQYTGLTDKNGNKIWENDVVKDNVVFGSVVWDEKYAQFMIDDEFDGHQDYSDWWQEVEVIGNIFDNPELLDWGNEDAE